MFFYLSKVFWLVADPGNFLFLLFTLAVLCLWFKWFRLGRLLATTALVLAGTILIFPIGRTITTELENRFPFPTDLPERVDGVIVLGGVIDQFVSAGRGQTSTNGAVERLIAMGELARRYPEARLVFTGGSGVLGHQDLKEADYAAPLLQQLGIDVGRIKFESESRNTAENALLSKRMVDPRPDEIWLLVTSAFHLPRAVGAFRKLGWRITPYPVDYSTTGRGSAEPVRISDFQLTARLGALRVGLHEIFGLAAYRMTDRSDALYPGPDDDRTP